MPQKVRKRLTLDTGSFRDSPSTICSCLYLATTASTLKKSSTDTILVNLFDTVGEITLGLFPKVSLGEISWVGFAMGFDRLHVCGNTLVKLPKAKRKLESKH